MRAAVITPQRGLTTTEVTVPEPAEGQVRITVAYCGVCGSDLHMLHGGMTPAGFVLGHEFSGQISALGPAVNGLTLGDRVTVLALSGCGECAVCQLGHPAACADSVPFGPGIQRPGGLAEEVIVPADRVVPLPDAVDDQMGALAEPLAVAMRGVELAQITDPATSTVVMGAGPVGLLVAEVLRARGITDVVLFETRQHRRDRAAALGWQAIDPEEAAPSANGTPVVFFDCTGHAGAFARAQELMPIGATLVLVGMTTEPIQINGLAMMTKEWTIRGSLGYDRRDMENALTLLAEGKIRTDQLITRVVDLDEVDSVFSDLADPGSTQVKVLLRPGR